MCEVITFFDKKKEYRCLSNFWEGMVEIIDGDEKRVYLSGELCFHGEKYYRLSKIYKDDYKGYFRGEKLWNYSKRFMVGGDILSSKDAKMKGGKGKNGLRLNEEELKMWNKLSIDVQYEICKYKLENFEEVRENLIRSKYSVLIHPAMRCNDDKMKDKFWEGRMKIKEDGSFEILGGNKLGNIWMELRENLVM
jgi:predicted NAD-dependent protein-ADP-ribosyltransferase YbiA (DUF1768 family)